MERVVQAVLKAEMTAHLGALPYERSPERRGYRNGYKPRTLKTRVGTLWTRATNTCGKMGGSSAKGC